MSGTERIVVLGEQRLDGAWFTPHSPHETARFLEHPTGRSDLLHVATDDIARVAHIRTALVAAIKAAAKKVMFCSFLFADDQIVTALCEAAERLHGGVYVLTSLGKHLRPELDADAGDAAKQRERATRHGEHLRRLARAGVWIRSTDDCHAKFVSIDDEVAIVTSANATEEAYETNPEDGLVTLDRTNARELGRMFAHVWRHLATLESVPGSVLDVHSIGASRAPDWRKLAGSGPITPVATLRKSENSLRSAAIEVINAARQHLTIATYKFTGMETHPIGKALQRALDRGIELDLLTRPMNHVAAHRKTCAWLMSLAHDRVRIWGHRKTHTKSIVADDADALLWTGNLDAAHGWEDGIEVGIRVRDAGSARAIAAWTCDVMRRATHAAVHSPSANDLVSRGAQSPLSGGWEAHITANASVDRVAALVQRGPVELVEYDGGIAFKCADDALGIELDRVARRVQVLSVTRAERLGKTTSLGWVADCTMRLSNQGKVTSL